VKAGIILIFGNRKVALRIIAVLALMLVVGGLSFLLSIA
jgi:uncharacterized membrane protein (DUF4010 family)